MKRMVIPVVAVLGTVLGGCGGGSTEDFCRSFGRFQELPADASVEDVRDEVRSFVDAAPDEIEGDAETLQTTFDDVVAKAEELDIDLSDPEALQSNSAGAEEIFSILSEREAAEASENIDAFYADHCEPADGEN